MPFIFLFPPAYNKRGRPSRNAKAKEVCIPWRLQKEKDPGKRRVHTEATSEFHSLVHEFENVHGMGCANRNSSPQDLYTMTLALGATEATSVVQRPRYRKRTQPYRSQPESLDYSVVVPSRSSLREARLS